MFFGGLGLDLATIGAVPLGVRALKTEKLWCAKITLRKKSDPIITKVLWFSTLPRAAFADELFEGSEFMFAGLLAVNGIGQSVAGVLPTERQGGLVLENSRGTIRWDLRFSDLLASWSIIDAPVSIFSFQKPKNTIGDEADFVTEFVGVARSARAAGNSISIDIDGQEFPTFAPQILCTTARFPDMDDRHVGRYLPIVFGSAETIGAKISVGAQQCKFAYATTFGSQFPVGGISQVRATSHKGNVVDIENPATQTTPLAGTTKDGFAATRSFVTNEVERAIPFTTGSSGFIVVGGCWFMRKTGTVDGRADFFLREKVDGDVPSPPDQYLTKAHNAYSNLTFHSTTSESPAVDVYKLPFEFENFVVLEPNTTYYVTWLNDALGTGVSSATNVSRIGKSDVLTTSAWVRLSTPEEVVGLWTTSTQDDDYLELYGVRFEDSPVPDASKIDSLTGLGYAEVAAQRNSAFSQPDISTLDDVYFQIDGLVDDAFGVLTGTPGAELNKANRAAALISYKTNGDALTYYDQATYEAEALLETEINGATEGATPWREILKPILMNAAAKMFALRNGKLAFWPYGYSAAPALTLTEDDCRIESIEVSSPESMVNSARVVFERRVAPLKLADVQNDLPKNYAQTFEFVSNLDDRTAAFVSDSVALYGLRELNEQFFQLDWCNDSAAVRRFIEYVFATASQEQIIVTISAPFWKNNFRTLEFGDIVRLSHVDLPAPQGSGSENITRPPFYGGASATNFNQGYKIRRAQSFNARIEAREIDGAAVADEARLKLRLRLLTNEREIA